MSQKNPLERDEWTRETRDAVELHLGVEVEAVGTFERPQKWWQNTGDATLILHAIFHLISRPFARDPEGRLGDLPERFLLAVTGDQVYALSYEREFPSGSIQVKKRVAAFDRKSISIYKMQGGDWADVMLELTEAGRSSRIKVDRNALNAEENPQAAEVVGALSK